MISGSATGVVQGWDIRDNALKPVMSSDQAPVDKTTAGVTVKPRRVRCLATTEETVYWGDDGVNMKAMDLNSGREIVQALQLFDCFHSQGSNNRPLPFFCAGKLRKIRNHVTEFGSTGAMATTGSCLVSAGYDLDRGNGYLNGTSVSSTSFIMFLKLTSNLVNWLLQFNLFFTGLVRSLPSEEYVATVDDECTGSITCLSCTQTTRDQVTLHRMCTGGLELKLWDQLPSSKVKKRSRFVMHFLASNTVIEEMVVQSKRDNK